MDIQTIKNRFGIIGNSPGLNRAIEIAVQVASTELSVLITGESGTGKEVFPQIIHQFSPRKHNTYIAVNCGAIPEGTIDSELFGHEKGSFTGATDKRKGYFEVADKGTIFLDEVAEMPLSTQARLLRVLETGEFFKVGSSIPQKTNVRVVAATNVDLQRAIQNGRFREDLFYRLSTIPIYIPPLRQRGDDIWLLARKFASDFAEKYRMPAIRFLPDAQQALMEYSWPGNVRQLKNVIEQISIIETQREINADTLKRYLPEAFQTKLPALVQADFVDQKTFNTEREILFQILFDMRKDITELKQQVHDIINERNLNLSQPINAPINENINIISKRDISIDDNIEDTEIVEDETLSIQEKEKELIKKALEKYNGRRKLAAAELGISERTLYRKIKEYNLS
ncbi:MAG: sigma-54 dependent transcriptional regulator [Bacteroidales bacterium]|nr:sigma-54 dependent transcriptional regulator [Bacteroidales bacterium]